MGYSKIIFDLDGTITEPVEGITNALIYALGKFHIQVEERSSLFKFIGPPLIESFREIYGFDDEKAKQAVAYYREYYSDRGLIENEIMPGMDNALMRLRDVGLKLFVATSKPEIYAKKILDNLGLLQYFDVVAGALLDGSRDKKELVIQYLLDNIIKSPDDLSQCIMVGDRRFDIEGAISCKLDNLGVTFGYGTKEELINAGAMYVADTPDEMVAIILG